MRNLNKRLCLRIHKNTTQYTTTEFWEKIMSPELNPLENIIKHALDDEGLMLVDRKEYYARIDDGR